MDKQDIASAVKALKGSSKRNFKQSIDLIINLRGINIKKAEEQVNTFVTWQHGNGRDGSVCAFIGPELEAKAKAVCNEIVLLDDFEKFKNKKDMKKLAERHDFFIAQANIMPKIATQFGRVFGPRGKMPNPKIGAVVAPNANLEPLVAKLKYTSQLVTKNDPTIRCMVGKEDTADDIVAENIWSAYNTVLQKLPNDKNNVKSVMVKLTMGPAITIGKAQTEEETDAKKKKKGAKKHTEALKPAEAEKAQPQVESPSPTESKEEKAPKESKKEKAPKEKSPRKPKKKAE